MELPCIELDNPQYMQEWAPGMFCTIWIWVWRRKTYVWPLFLMFGRAWMYLLSRTILQNGNLLYHTNSYHKTWQYSIFYHSKFSALHCPQTPFHHPWLHWTCLVNMRKMLGFLRQYCSIPSLLGASSPFPTTFCSTWRSFCNTICHPLPIFSWSTSTSATIITDSSLW